MRRKRDLVLLLVAAMGLAGRAAEPPMRPDYRYLPGVTATPWLTYGHPAATSVWVKGLWDGWAGAVPMQQSNGVWVLDTRTLGAPFGRYEFKFLPDGAWESGDNRDLFLNRDGLMDQPSALIYSAEITAVDEINVMFRTSLAQTGGLAVAVLPDVPVREWHVSSGREDGSLQGYFSAGGVVTFVFDEERYKLRLGENDHVAVAGNFTGWDGGGCGGRWVLHRGADPRVRELSVPLANLRPPPGEAMLLYKFVVNGSRWLAPPCGALSAVPDGHGNTNLRVDPSSSGGLSVRIRTADPLDLAKTYAVLVEGVTDRAIWRFAEPGRVFQTLRSDKPLGVELDREHGCTTYRLFAPRASSVHLNLFDRPEYQVYTTVYRRVDQIERYPMWKDASDGVWEISLMGSDVGRYYAFNVDGPSGNGEGFWADARIGDPYALAAAHAHNNSIVMDPEATNRWFAGWTDREFRSVAPQDAVIYELHIRDMTAHPLSGVAPPLAGKYEGLVATAGTGAGLDHLKDLGVNTVEIMPLCEFSNGEGEYNWGYSPVFYFAPEASFARSPLTGSQVYEFKRLVNELHRHGLTVIVDMVFNHVGEPNLFHHLDKKYYFRLNPDFSYSNFSGCGNDVRTEAPMMRRLIVDSIRHWMTEFHVDGFRFDLAELIDLDTLLAIRDAARAINPNALLISEPWSLRGENKYQLKGTGWSAWNNDFRYAAKDFAMGRHNREWLQKNLLGSVDTWAANPLQPVNYLESHDDMALADELCTRPDRDGRSLQEQDVAVNRLAATVLFTALGIPMISEGQEFIRSKWGFGNTYNRGDDVNALRWTERERPRAAEALAYYRSLIRLRGSEDGAAFRVAQRAPEGYYRWIIPPDGQALGYVVNAPRLHAGAGFVVLLNASGQTTAFTFQLPAGRWRLIGDGEKLDPAGLPGENIIEGPRDLTVQVPGIRAFLFKNGF